MALAPEYKNRILNAVEKMEQDGIPREEIQAQVNRFKDIYDPAARFDETDFQAWYQEKAVENNLDPNPDDPRHFYNYRAAFRTGAEPDETGHWPSKFKMEGHPNLIIDGVDTRTGKEPDWSMFINPQPYFEKVQPTALIPTRSRQVVGREVSGVKEVPSSVYKQADMQLEEPNKTNLAMEPVEITKQDIGLKNIIPAAKSSFKRVSSALAEEAGRKLGAPVQDVNPEFYAAGKQIVESGKDPKDYTFQDKFYVTQYKSAESGKALEAWAKPKAEQLKRIGAIIQESIPEKDRMAVQDAQEFLTSGAAKDPKNIGKTVTAILTVSADQTANTAMAFTGPVAAVPMVAQEKQSWVESAKAMGLDDEELLDKFGDNYAIPSGIAEYGTSALIGAPLKAVLKNKKVTPIADKLVGKVIKNAVLKSVMGNVLGTVGTASLEGITEMSQAELQDAVTYWALTEAAKKNPDKAEQYIASRDQLNLNPLTKEKFDNFIVGFAASLPQNIAARVLGGIGRAANRRAGVPETAPNQEVTREDLVAPTPAFEPIPEKTPAGPVDANSALNAMTPDEQGALRERMQRGIDAAKGPQPTPTQAAEQLSNEEAAAIMARSKEPLAMQAKVPMEAGKATPEIEARVKDSAGDLLGKMGNYVGKSVTEDAQSLRNTTNETRGIFGEETNTPEQVVAKYDQVMNKLGVDSYRKLADMKPADLDERLRTLDAKEQTFIDRVNLADIESYKNEQRRIAGNIPQGEQNGEEKGQGRLQVEEPEYRAPSAREFAVMTPEQKDAAYSRLKEEAETDQLTSLINRQGAKDRGYLRMEKVVKDGEETTQPVWQKREDGTEDMAVLDIDNFGKGVNNYYGHPTGDKVLSDLGNILRHNLKGLADVVRYGGEEIAIIPLKNVDRGAILKGVEESRKDLHGQVYKTSKGDLTGVTFSAGYGNNNDEADAALYKAKESGKARTFSGEKQYAENDLRPTEIREPRRRTEDTGGIAEEAGAVLQGKGKAPDKGGVTEPAGPSKKVTSKPSPKKAAPAAAQETKEETAPKPPDESRKSVGSLIDKALADQESSDKARDKATDQAAKHLPKKLRKKVVVKISKNPPPEAAKKVDENGEWEAAVWYNPHGQVVEVHLNDKLSPDKYAEALYHELPGHVGQRLVFADSPNILNTMRQMFKAAKGRGDMDVQALERAYAGDIKKAGEAGDDILFEEWVAHNLHRYLIQNDRQSLPSRIYNLVRSALVKIGVVKENVDDVMREMIKRMSKAKDIGIIEGKLSKSFKRPVEEAAPAEKSNLPESMTKSVSPGEVNLEVNDETKFEAFRRVTQDRFFRLRRLMEAAEKQTGKPLSDDLNTYVKQDIINSKIQEKVDSFQKKYIDDIADIAIKNKLSVKEIDDYLYAKHKDEADRVVGARRPDMVKEGKPPSGLSKERQDQIFADAKKAGHTEALEKISDIVQRWNKARLDMMVEDGLLTKEQRDQFQEEYKNYIPLKGIPDEEGNPVEMELPRTGKGYNVASREFRMRKGRTSEAQNILAHLAMDTMEKAVRGEKNKVIRSLYEFNKQFKNDLIKIEPVIIGQEFDKKSGTFKSVKKSNYEISQTDRYGAPVNFKIDGKPMQMLIEDEPLMRAMRNMGSSEGDAFVKIITKHIMPIQRYLSMVRTQLAVNFIPSNFLRDTMTAQINALGLDISKDQQKGLGTAILKGVPKSMRSAYEGQMGKDTEGAKKYNEFVKEGGAIEFFGLKDVKSIQKSLVSQINNMKPGLVGQGRRLMRGAYDYITILNGAVENANRLSVYTELTNRGVSKQQAAYIAKNLTTNFNRKGEMGTYLNAWAIFANASIQGSVRLLKALKDSNAVKAVAGSIVAASLAHAELMRSLLGDDDDDKEAYYDKISDFTRDTHMVLPLGNLAGKDTKNYLRIPLPYGYNVFWAFGQHLSRVLHGGAEKIPDESLRFAGVIADAFNPIGGQVDLSDPKSMARNFAPTILQPLAELAVNQNFMGGPVYKEQLKGYGTPPTYSHSALKNTPEAFQNATKWASDITGGGKYRGGVFDKVGVFSSPDVINHLWEFGTGGVGKMVTDLISMPFEWKNDKKISLKTIPVAQRFYGEINEYKDVKTLYDNLDKADKINKDFKNYKDPSSKDYNPQKAKQLMKEYPAIISLMSKKEGEGMDKNMNERKSTFIPLNRRVIKKLEDLNKLRQKYDEKGDKEAVKKIEKRIIDHAQEWNLKLEKFLKPREAS